MGNKTKTIRSKLICCVGFGVSFQSDAFIFLQDKKAISKSIQETILSVPFSLFLGLHMNSWMVENWSKGIFPRRVTSHKPRVFRAGCLVSPSMQTAQDQVQTSTKMLYESSSQTSSHSGFSSEAEQNPSKGNGGSGNGLCRNHPCFLHPTIFVEWLEFSKLKGAVRRSQASTIFSENWPKQQRPDNSISGWAVTANGSNSLQGGLNDFHDRTYMEPTVTVNSNWSITSIRRSPFPFGPHFTFLCSRLDPLMAPSKPGVACPLRKFLAGHIKRTPYSIS